MRKRFESAWQALGVPPQSAVLVGVSGGVDSVVLLHCLCALRDCGMLGKLYAAHLDHGIRGEQAQQEARFVQTLCEAWSVPCTIGQADVPARAAQEGESMEAAARAARYAFLEEARLQCGAAYLVVAHHADDQAETVLLHLLRGTGLAGLCGMRAQNGRVLRPMLGLYRHEIEAYAMQNGISFCTDASNFDPAYLRNRLRLSLIPQLQAAYNPALVTGLCRMAGLCAQDEDYLTAEAKSALDAARLPGGGVSRNRLAALPMALKSRALRQLLDEHGALYDADYIRHERLCALLDAPTGKRVAVGNGLWAWTSYDALYVGELPTHEACCIPLRIEGETPVPGGRFIAAMVNARRDEGPSVAHFDFDRLPQGIVVRTRLPGDRFQPLGAPGARKLKAYLIDRKVPCEDRMLPMLCAGEEVLFVPGQTIAHTVRVREDTVHILRIAFERDSAPRNTHEKDGEE